MKVKKTSHKRKGIIIIIYTIYLCVCTITVYIMSYQNWISVKILFLATHSLRYLCELDGRSPFSSVAPPFNLKTPVASKLKGCVESVQ